MFTRVKQENQVFSIPFNLFNKYKQITQSLIVFTVLRVSALFSKEPLLMGGRGGGLSYGWPLLSGGPLLLGEGGYFPERPLLSEIL